MTMSNAVPARHRASLGGALLAASWAAIAGAGAMAQENLPNACPVDGCEVTIAEVAKAGDELAVTLDRSEEHTSELQSLMRISYAVFCLTKKKVTNTYTTTSDHPTYQLYLSPSRL